MPNPTTEAKSLPAGLAVVKIADVKVGDFLIADGGFPCIAEGALLEVRSDDDGLYVECRGPDGEGKPGSERHHLDGQLTDKGDEIVGFWLAPTYRELTASLRKMVDAYREGVADDQEPSMVRDALALLAKVGG